MTRRSSVAVLEPLLFIAVHRYLPESVYSGDLFHTKSSLSSPERSETGTIVSPVGKLPPFSTLQVKMGVGMPSEEQENVGAMSPCAIVTCRCSDASIVAVGGSV